MNKDAFHLLERIYGNYRDILQGQKKKKIGSVLISSLEVKNNVRFRSLSEASVSGMDVEYSQLSELLDLGLLREADVPSRYTITARGIWEVETRRNTINESKLVDYIDAKSFDVFGGEPSLTDKEKVIVMSLIASRAFWSESSVDLYRDDTLEDWRSIVEDVFEKLADYGVIAKLEKSDLFGSAISERPLSNLLRHTDALPRKTRALFKAPGKQKYYLELYDGKKFSNESLDYLVRLVFGGRITPSNLYDVHDFCNKIAHNKGIRIFDLDKHPFLSMEYDDVILESLRKSSLHTKVFGSE